MNLTFDKILTINQEDLSSALLVVIYLGLLLFTAETLSRKYQLESEITRKIVHIGAGQVILIAWWLKIPSNLIIIASGGAVLVAIISYLLPILPSVNGVGRKSLGTLFYALSIGILAWLFWQKSLPEFTVIGILIMTWGDALAALIGQKWGKNKYVLLGNKKSWQGSFTMMLVSFIVVLVILTATQSWQSNLIIVAVLTGIIATFLEAFSWLGIDNLTVPVMSAIFCYYLQQILN